MRSGPGLGRVEFPKLDSFKVDIDAWLTEDKRPNASKTHGPRFYQGGG